jgi:hypothetical protein
MQINLRIIALLMIFAILCILLCAVMYPAKAAESPGIERMVDYEGGLNSSSFPNNLVPVDLLRVDVDLNKTDTDGYLNADVTLLCVPDNLYTVILTDGYHIFQAVWTQEEDTLHLKFAAEELKKLDSTVGLWLITVQKI